MYQLNNDSIKTDDNNAGIYLTVTLANSNRVAI